MEFDTNLVVLIILRINEGLAFDLAIQEKEACEVLKKIPWTVKVCGQSIVGLFSPLIFRMFIMLWDFCFYKNNEMNYDCEQYCNSRAKFFSILYHVQGYVKKKTAVLKLTVDIYKVVRYFQLFFSLFRKIKNFLFYEWSRLF